jgi:hypothetical protein
MLNTILLLPLLGGPPMNVPPRPGLALAVESQDADERFEALTDEMSAIVAEWRAVISEARAASEAGDKEAMDAIPMRPDFSALAPKFEQAAADYAGSDDAVAFLMWMLTQGGEDAGKKAIVTLTSAHAGSALLAEYGGMFPNLDRMCSEEAAQAFIAAVKAENKNIDVIGWVTLTQLGDTVNNAELDSDEYKSARKELLGIAEKVESDELRDKIQGSIDLREKFGEGVVSPDIEGIDLDGTDFKLSDYKGKIVFLDFWGDW